MTPPPARCTGPPTRVNDEIAYLGEQAPTSGGLAVVDRATQRRAVWAALVAGGAATVGDATQVEGAPV